MNHETNPGQPSQRVFIIDETPVDPEIPTASATPTGQPKRQTASNTSRLQSGTGQRNLTENERFQFDLTGYLPLGKLLDPPDLTEARAAIANTENLPAGVTVAGNELELELRNIVEIHGTLGEIFGDRKLYSRMLELIWGNQVRLISSRALVRHAGFSSRVTQGGRADPRRFGRYRAFLEGEFRCILISVLIALDDTSAGDGAVGVIPASHKANFAYPYEQLAEHLPMLRCLPLEAGEALLYTVARSHALTAPRTDDKRWLLYQYGPSYMLDWPDCTPTAAVHEQAAADPVRANLLRRPYYH